MLKSRLKPSSALDAEGKRKWRQLLESVDEDVDGELLGLYCATYGSLMAIRREKTKLESEGRFEMLVRGRDGSEVLNPLLVAERRLISSLSRMLKQLGLAPTREEQERRKTKPQADEISPLEAALCWPYGFEKIHIWREIRRGKVKVPTNAAEEAERRTDQAEADRQLAAWKTSVGIVDDGDAPVAAPGPNASVEEWHGYHIACVKQREQIEGAIRRAGLDPRKA